MIAGFSAAGIKVGEQFQIVGFDDIEEASHSYPKLSSVRCDVNTFGRTTAELLLDWLETGKIPDSEVRYPVELVQRDSSV